VVRVPSVVDEDRRQLHRDLRTTKRDRTRVINRSKGLLAGWGIRLGLPGEGARQLEEVRQWDGPSLPPALRARLQREWQQVQQRMAKIPPFTASGRLSPASMTVWRASGRSDTHMTHLSCTNMSCRCSDGCGWGAENDEDSPTSVSFYGACVLSVSCSCAAGFMPKGS
jgi:hypothetical protein